MRPSSIQVLRSLPRTPNGKIDRNALPSPAEEPAPTPAESTQARSDVEQRLARVWESVLGIHNIKNTADFFDMGGNSLLAARLLARIKEEFGRNIALSTLFKEPSIQGLATLLERGALRELDFRQVIKLRHNGSKMPLIGVNSTGIYHDLSKSLGADQPFTALQLFDPSCNPPALPRSLEDIAAEYVQLILRVQPDGPYALVGWCVGCGLAWEIAQQLRRSGRDVSLLVLVDGWVPGYLRRQSKSSAMLAHYSYRWQLLMVSWNAVISGQQSLSAFLADRKIVRRSAELARRIAIGANPAPAENGEQLTAEAYDERLQIYLVEAAKRYDPKAYAGRIMVFRSAEQPTRFLDHSLGWAPYAAGGLEVVTLPGDHYSIFRGASAVEMAARISAGLAVHTLGSNR
jgi:thioesterase domain-containing protein/acyl carrier protein